MMTDDEVEGLALQVSTIKSGEVERGWTAPPALDEMRTRLAAEYGRRHGWTHRKYDRAEPSDLAGRWVPPEVPKLVDHPFVFRRDDGTVAAVAGHVYRGQGEDVRRACEATAHAAGVRVSFPADFPSWWFPAETTLVLFEPEGAP